MRSEGGLLQMQYSTDCLEWYKLVLRTHLLTPAVPQYLVHSHTIFSRSNPTTAIRYGFVERQVMQQAVYNILTCQDDVDFASICRECLVQEIHNKMKWS